MLQRESDGFYAGDQFLSDLSAVQGRRSHSEDSGRERPSILVVDDHAIIADTLVEILNLSGFAATAAYDGHSALQLAAETHPDYLLTDVVMPSMNGVELAMAIRKMRPETTILLFSGQAGTRDMLNEARQQGYSFELIAKPIHPECLLEHLRARRT